jgi:hypothetical protein
MSRLKEWLDAKLLKNCTFSKLFWWHRIADFEDDFNFRLTEVNSVFILY